MDTKHLTRWLHIVIIKCYLLSQFPPHFLFSLFSTDTSIHSNPLLHPITSNLLPKTVCSTFLLSFRLWCIQRILNICWMPNTFLGTKDSEMNTYQSLVISSVQSLSRVWLFVTPWTAARQASLSITNSWSLLKLMSIELVMPSNHLILCCPLLLPPSIFPSIRIFSNESVLHIRWPKDSSSSFSISPFKEYSGLISFKIDWLDLLAVQGTLKSLLQHHSSKVSILWHTAFITVSHPYMTTGKTIDLTRRTFVGKVMSLLFKMLSGLVIAFLPRSTCLLISWLQSPSAVILEPLKIVSHCFHCFPIHLPWSDGTGCHTWS